MSTKLNKNMKIKNWSSLSSYKNALPLKKHKQTFMYREMAGFVHCVGFNLLQITDLRGPETKQTNLINKTIKSVNASTGNSQRF